MTRLALALVLLGACAAPEPSPGAHPDIRATAPSARIDRILAEQWAEAGVQPSVGATDAEFLRRVSLDLIGRVPTQAEVEAFVGDPRPNKRAELVDALLATDAFAEYWAGLWADVLLPGDAKTEKLARAPLERYLADSLASGRSWELVARELLSSTGELSSDPQLAFVAARGRGADKSERLAELASTSSRVFLGSRIECAQCHDHPHAPEFSREDFWSTVAWFGRVEIGLDRGSRPPRVEIGERSRGELRVALTSGSERRETVAPAYFGSPDEDGVASRRERFAELVVADPRFAGATIGFVWTRLFGRGIVEPWDDLLGREPADWPALLRELADELRNDDHDLRGSIRTIVLSQAYARSSRGNEDPSARAAAEHVFARASVRPLSAEQLFDSLILATGIDRLEDRGFAQAVQERERKALREYEFVFADEEMAAGDAFTGNVPQAMLLLNGGLTNHAVVARPGSTIDRLLEVRGLEARITTLWRTVYARDPSPEEWLWVRALVAADPDAPEPWEDLLFAMLQSTEFASNH